MKILRVLLLVFLALLLPIRGAVAGAMLCPQGHPPPVHEQVVEHHEHDMHGQDHHHDQADHDSGCNLCASFCSMTSLLSAMPTLMPSTLAATLSFPALSAPAPTFQSDGQDRPPRST